MQSVKSPILVDGGVFKEYELHKVQSLTHDTSQMTQFFAKQLV